jgi:nitrate/nitrite-specific signal transduction histidine kinase
MKERAMKIDAQLDIEKNMPSGAKVSLTLPA